MNEKKLTKLIGYINKKKLGFNIEQIDYSGDGIHEGIDVITIGNNYHIIGGDVWVKVRDNNTQILVTDKKHLKYIKYKIKEHINRLSTELSICDFILENWGNKIEYEYDDGLCY